MRVTPALVVLAVVLASAPLSGSMASAEPGRSRVIDRTFLCSTGFLGGIYQLDIEGYYSTPDGSQRKRFASYASTNLPKGFLAGVSGDAVSVNRRHCRGAQGTIPLSAKGLRGAVVGPFGQGFQCATPRRVLIRVRGVFARPTALRAVSFDWAELLRASGVVREAGLAIATMSGKPIAFVAYGRKSRLLTSTHCKED